MLLLFLYFTYIFEMNCKLMEEETILTPSISVKPKSTIPAGSNITIHCDGAKPREMVILYKNGGKFLQQQSDNSTAEFIIVNVSLKHQGSYFCMMHSDSRISNHLKIEVQEQDRIFLSSTPRGSILSGSNVTLQCNGTKREETVSLFKDGELYEQKTSSGSAVEFLFSHVDIHHEGTYYCLSSSSKRSNTIYIWIQEEEFSPTESGVTEDKKKDFTRGNIIRICAAVVILVVLIAIVSEYCYSMKEPQVKQNECATKNEYELNF
ncbi:leukocyte immunoglobulin-like receptor subfamily A member 2 isoform X3 [Engystomops pustulosus]|uniref:leukocyte immunoglobulin-like receptor subfamily A member 2 isoform X3 n=1 Tax=Engystomops pustulosus TaxID=76066 RepID=UPI003AFB3A9F